MISNLKCYQVSKPDMELHGKYNIRGIAHAHTNRKDDIFMQGRLVQTFTFILEWGQGTCSLTKHTRRWAYSRYFFPACCLLRFAAFFISWVIKQQKAVFWKFLKNTRLQMNGAYPRLCLKSETWIFCCRHCLNKNRLSMKIDWAWKKEILNEKCCLALECHIYSIGKPYIWYREGL